MGFGVIMTVDNKLSEALSSHLIEVRVEQFLAEPTNFAVRFADDMCEGRPEVLELLGLDQLARPKSDRKVALFVEIDGKPRCLVHGVIEKLQGQVVKGGPGSWVEIRGRDRRVVLDRKLFQGKRSRLASDAVVELLEQAEFACDVARTTRQWDEKQQTLNHKGSALELIDKVARDYGFSFWIKHELAKVNDTPRIVKEIAMVQASPPRLDEQGKKLQLARVKLTPTTQKHLVLSGGKDECANVSQLQLEVDWNRVTSARAKGLDDTSTDELSLTAALSQSPLGKGGAFLRDIGPQKEAAAEGPADPLEQQHKLEAALDAEAWFVTATASTTLHMLGDVLFPHDIVCVTGMGELHSGAYQVKQVTHVINAAEHYMDVELRRNTLGGGDECATKT